MTNAAAGTNLVDKRRNMMKSVPAGLNLEKEYEARKETKIAKKTAMKE